jgi:Tetratricopeptide repeat
MAEYFENVPLVLQGAFTLWMLVDAFRRGEGYWPWIILFGPGLGAWGYFLVVMLPRWTGGRGWSLPTFRRGPSLDELRFRAEHSPTVASHLDLAERLTNRDEFAEAMPHLDEVLAREPDHCRALFLLAKCHAGLGQLDKAIPCLEKITSRERYWSNYAAWYAWLKCVARRATPPAPPIPAANWPGYHRRYGTSACLPSACSTRPSRKRRGRSSVRRCANTSTLRQTSAGATGAGRRRPGGCSGTWARDDGVRSQSASAGTVNPPAHGSCEHDEPYEHVH